MNEQDRIDELAALLDGDLAPEDASQGLAGLLTLAQTVREESEVVGPTLAFRMHLREQLLAEAAPAPTVADRVRDLSARVRRSTRVAVATATASAVVGGVGVAAAAQEAVPGDLLHPVKTGIENLRIGLAGDALTEARLELAFATERLTELESVRATDADVVIGSLHEMDQRSSRGAEVLLADGLDHAELLVELTDFTGAQRARLAELLDRLPLQARPVVEDSLELLRRIEVRVSAAAPALLESLDLPSSLVPSLDGEPAEATCDCPEGTVATTTSSTSLGTGVPLVGDGPVDPGCMCVEVPGGPSAREPWPTPEGGRLSEQLGEGFGETDDDPIGLEDVVDGLGLTTGDAAGDVVEDLVDPIDDVLDDVLDTDVPLDDVTGPVTDTLDDLGSLLGD